VSAKKKGAAGPFDGLKPLRDALQHKEAAEKAPKRASATPKPSHAEPEDESLVFHRLFAGVAPLSRARGRIPRERLDPSPAVAASQGKRVAERAQAEADAVHQHLRTLVEGRARFEVVDDGRRVEGRRVDVAMEVVRKLRRGSLPIDSRLDLHGMTVPEARGQLELFLRTMRARGERYVLVIHGKGEHSPSGTGVLRGEISAWLSQGASSEHVAAFATAHDRDGGEGAVYILIRR
jgi:DNA-nicking Smr family endonuclease